METKKGDVMFLLETDWCWHVAASLSNIYSVLHRLIKTK